jgi:hypothetical protein
LIGRAARRSLSTRKPKEAAMPTRRTEDFGDPIGRYQLRIEDQVVGSFTTLSDADPGHLTLKRGYIRSEDLLRWRQEFVAGRGVRKSGSVEQTRPGRGVVGRWIFTNALPMKLSVLGMASMDGKGNDVLTEEMVIAVEKVERG